MCVHARAHVCVCICVCVCVLARAGVCLGIGGLSKVVVVVGGTYFEYMAVKPLIVPSYSIYTFFQRVCNACNNNFPKLYSKASKSYCKFRVIVQQILK